MTLGKVVGCIPACRFSATGGQADIENLTFSTFYGKPINNLHKIN
jgi:hypothetical protein